MRSNYIVRLDEGTLCCFCHDSGTGISRRIYKNGKWQRAAALVEDANENYTVNIAYDGSVYIFTQDRAGGINLCTNNGGEWKTRPIFKNRKDGTVRISFSALITESGLNLLYNMPEDTSQWLVSQMLNQRGQWGPANKIDSIVPLHDNIFQVQRVAPGHGLVFYQTVNTQQRVVETSLGYREVSAGKIGAYNVFHTTTFTVTDYSFLTTNSAVYVAFIIKTMFSCQLIFRKKTDKNFTNPIVVYEGQKINNCLIQFIKGKLNISFSINGQMFFCSEDNGGASFTTPVRYRNKICQSPVKATYLSVPEMSEASFYCSELYVDAFCPWDIQMLPDMYEDFFPEPFPEPAEGEKAEAGPEEILKELEYFKKQFELVQLQLMEKERIIKNLTRNNESI